MYQFKYKGGRCCYKQNIQKKDVGIHHGTSRGCLLLHSVGMCTFFRDALRLGLCRVELRRKDAKDRWKYSTWKQQTVLEHAWANMEKWRNVANFSSVLTLLWNCFKMHPSHIPPLQNWELINLLSPGGRWSSMFWQIQISGGGASKVSCHFAKFPRKTPSASKIYGLAKSMYENPPHLS